MGWQLGHHPNTDQPTDADNIELEVRVHVGAGTVMVIALVGSRVELQQWMDMA